MSPLIVPLALLLILGFLSARRPGQRPAVRLSDPQGGICEMLLLMTSGSNLETTYNGPFPI